MHKPLIALAFVAGIGIVPAAAQLSVGGVAGGVAGGATGAVGNVGGAAGAAASGQINTGAGSIGAGVNGSASTTLSSSERTALATQFGVNIDADADSGLIGRTVVGADGKVIGKVRSVSTSSDLGSVSSIAVGSSDSSAVSIDASKLKATDSGNLVASGVTSTDLSGLPKASGGASLIGRTVAGADGKTLGTIENVVVDGSGSISQVVLKAKGSGKIVAISRSQFSADGDSLKASQLTSAQLKAIAG